MLQVHIVELAGSYQSVAEDYAKIFEAMTQYNPQQFQGLLLCYDLQYQVVGQLLGKHWQPLSWPNTDTETRSVIICDDYDDGNYIFTVCVDDGIVVSISVKVKEFQISVDPGGSSGGGINPNTGTGTTGGNIPPPPYFPYPGGPNPGEPNPGGIPIWNG